MEDMSRRRLAIMNNGNWTLYRTVNYVIINIYYQFYCDYININFKNSVYTYFEQTVGRDRTLDISDITEIRNMILCRCF